MFSTSPLASARSEPAADEASSVSTSWNFTDELPQLRTRTFMGSYPPAPFRPDSRSLALHRPLGVRTVPSSSYAKNPRPLFTPEVARPDHLPQQRAGPVLQVPELRRTGTASSGITSSRPMRSARASGPTGSPYPSRIEVSTASARRDALHHHVHRLVEKRQDDAGRHVAGVLEDLDAGLAQHAHEPEACRYVSSEVVEAAHHLHQRAPWAPGAGSAGR